MANRLASKIKNFNFKVIPDSSVPRGAGIVDLHDEEVDEFSKLDPNDPVDAQIMNQTSKFVIAGAVIESAYKVGAAIESEYREGLEIAEEKIRSRLGISTHEASWSAVEKTMAETLEELNDQRKYIEKLDGRIGKVKKAGDGEDSGSGSGSGSGSDNGSGSDSDSGSGSGSGSDSDE